MEIGKYDITIPFLDKIINIDKVAPKSTRIIERIVKLQLQRQREDIKKWRDATTVAESVIRPDRLDLIRIYQDVVLDAHLTSLIQTIHLSVTTGKFFLVDSNDEINEEETKKLQTKWFWEFTKHAIDSLFWGHSLIQFGTIRNDAFTEIKLVPRENVVPEKKGVKKSIGDASTLIFYDKPPWTAWTIEVGADKDLGLMHKATPLVLWKKNTMIAWSEYTEIFGMPVRMGKTEISDPEKKKNMEDMLKLMGNAAYGVFHNDDTLEFVESKRGDAYNVYDKLIERLNSEMSKLILGQTMTADDGSSKSQAEVHENILKAYIKSIKKWHTSIVNDKLLPLMERHRMIPTGLRFKYDESPSTDEMFEKIKELLKFYTIPEDFIMETFNIPVEQKAAASFPGVENITDLADIVAASDTIKATMAIYNKTHG